MTNRDIGFIFEKWKGIPKNARLIEKTDDFEVYEFESPTTFEESVRRGIPQNKWVTRRKVVALNDTTRQWSPDGTSIPLKVKDGEIITPLKDRNGKRDKTRHYVNFCTGERFQVSKEKWGWKEVPKEPKGYYQLQGRYRFRNTIIGESVSMTGISMVTKRKRRGKELENLRAQAIEYARDNIPYLIEAPGEWVLEEVLQEVWLKW